MFETLPKPMNKIKLLPLAIALALSGCGSDETTPTDTGSHVASPDWQDQIIYFLMIDRFNKRALLAGMFTRYKGSLAPSART